MRQRVSRPEGTGSPDVERDGLRQVLAHPQHERGAEVSHGAGHRMLDVDEEPPLVEVVLAGRNIEDPTGLIFSHPGLKAELVPAPRTEDSRQCISCVSSIAACDVSRPT